MATQSIAGMESSVLERMRAAEIEEARGIQLAMLPREALRSGRIEFAFKFRPVSEVGGDFLDYFVVEDGSVVFYLGDVVGKGLPAAMFAALAVGALRGMHKTGTAPRSILQTLNRRLRMRVVPGRYCSVQYGVLNPASGEFRHANAGLPKPIRINSHGCEELGGGGLPSGLFEAATYDEYAAQLAPGDTLLFCTDGVTDARNPAGEDFGDERLLALCRSQAGASAEALLEHLFAAVDGFAAGERQQDDITVAALRLT
jgi:sigma-B regulation protein RsbU (phosphoserine phosphatase)